MKSAYRILCIACSALAFSSCSKVIAPCYTSVEQIGKLKSGMNINQTTSALGCNPYDLYYNTEDTTKTLFFYYKYKEQKVKPKVYMRRIDLKGGHERFTKVGSLFVTFKTDKIYQVSTKEGLLFGLHAMVYENTIREMKENPDDFIDPTDESRSFNKDFTPEEQSGYISSQPSAVQPPQQKSSFSLNPNKTQDIGVKKKSPGLAFTLSFLIPGTGEFYAKSNKLGTVVLTTWLAGTGLMVGGLVTGNNGLLIPGITLSAGTKLFSMIAAPILAKHYNKAQMSMFAGDGAFNYANKNMAMSLSPVGAPNYFGGYLSLRF